MLCNNLTLRYCDLKNNLNFNFKKQNRSTSKCSTIDSGFINFREVNRVHNIESFYIKEELLEMLINSICYDNMEKKLSSFRIPNYQETSVEMMEKIYKEENNKDKYKEIK